MKCPHCNQEVEDGITICPICGKEMPVTETEETETTETTETTVQEPEVVPAVEEEPAKKSKKTLVIAGIIAAAAVIAVGAAVMMPKKSPKDTVIDAFKSIVAEDQTDPMEELFGWNAMYTKMQKESSEVDTEFQLQESSDETINQLATGKFAMTAMSNVAEKKMAFDMGIGYANMDLANLEFYLDDKEMVAAIPEFSSKAFALNYADDLAGQIERSPYLGQMFADTGIDAGGFSDYLTKVNEMAASETKMFDVNALWTRYKEGSKAIDDLKAAMTVADAEKKNFTIDSKEVSCKGYNVTITKDAMVQFLTTTKDFFLTDETLKKDFIQYSGLITDLYGSMGSMYSDMADSTPEELQREAWTSAEEEVNALIAQINEKMGDLNMVVYVTKEDKMASFDYNTTMKIDTEELKVYGTVDFAGGYNMFANVNATVNIEDSLAQKISFVVNKTGAYEKDKSLTGEFTASMSNDVETYAFDIKGNYAADTGSYDLTLDVLANETSMGTISSTGLVQNLVKGESFELVMDSIRLESSMLTGSDEYIELSGFYKAGPLTSTIEQPDGNRFDILSATEEDWSAISTEIVGNVFALMGSLY